MQNLLFIGNDFGIYLFQLTKSFNGIASVASVKDTVKALTVDGVAAAEENIKDGSYVVQRPFVLVTKANVELSDAAQKFFDFITSTGANEIISAAGVVPAN